LLINTVELCSPCSFFNVVFHGVTVFGVVKLCGQVNTVSWTLTGLTWLGEKGWGK
jgi:hypothetical protein